MLDSRPGRVAALLAVGVLLAVVLVGAGTIPVVDLISDYEAAVGTETEADGTVVGTDPVCIDHDGIILRVRNADAVADDPISVGDRVVVYGEVNPEQTIVASEVVVRPAWAFQYLYAVSLVGGFWVLVRFLRGWRLNLAKFAFEPCDRRDS